MSREVESSRTIENMGFYFALTEVVLLSLNYFKLSINYGSSWKKFVLWNKICPQTLSES